jgi:hypothetical protein
MLVVPAQEFVKFDNSMKRLSSYFKWLLKHKPLIKKEWDLEDLSQELALKYFKNIIRIAHTLKSDDHRIQLLRKMASQITNDKLKEMQRKKRDIRKISNETIEFVEAENCEIFELMCNQEIINKLKSRMDNDIWRVLEWRSQGKSWQNCADEIGYCSPSALRIKIRRNISLIKSCI